ncbi:ATP-binding protein [Streptomyces sp. NPDC048290]|uniref:ATP-binding protein n=1 Tax=Streptomyces sp. NPDC048290 TaxID=3155811 RepID=UPI003447AEA0
MHAETVEMPPSARWPFTSLTPQVVPGVRRDVRRRITGWGYVADDTALVVTELLANVVRHANGRCVLTVGVEDGEILVACADTCPRRPRLREPDWESGTGRGMRLIAGASLAWGCEPLAGGKRVWVRLSAIPLPRLRVTAREDMARALRGEEPARVIDRCWFGCGRADVPGVLTGVASSDFGDAQMFACARCVGRLSRWIHEDVLRGDEEGLSAR